MSETGDIPLFRGTETPEEAERWLQLFVNYTGSFSDSGIFRLLLNTFPNGSPSQEWFDALEESLTASWKVFRREFYSRWITISQQWRDQLAWDAFRNHVLAEDTIFGGESTDKEYSHNALSAWVEDHLRLGNATDGKDGVLVETTKCLLPLFVRAYLKVYVESQPRTLDDICSNIKGIPYQILELERVRRQMSSAGQNPSMERGFEEVSKKLERLIQLVGQSSDVARPPAGLPHGDVKPVDQTDVSSSESIRTTSKPCTPLAQSMLLPNPSEYPAVEERSSQVVCGDVLYCIPQQWRKPVSLKSRDELIVIAADAIDLIDESSLCEDYNLLQGIRDLYSYSTHQTTTELLASVEMWLAIASALPENPDLTYQSTLDQKELAWSNYGGIFGLTPDPSWHPSLIGGIFDTNKTNVEACAFFISSIRTVLFMTLSSYLAECTGEGRYREAAILSANCINNWMLDHETFLVKDCFIDALACEVTSGAVLSCHLTGIVIEGFSLLASVTHDEIWQTLAIKIAIAAIRYSNWHSAEGILIVGADGERSQTTDEKAFKGLLNRGLMTAYERNRSNEGFCNLVRSYINVQFNALFECARFENSYGIEWRGPYAGPYIHGQIVAVDTIVAAIGVSEA